MKRETKSKCVCERRKKERKSTQKCLGEGVREGKSKRQSERV